MKKIMLLCFFALKISADSAVADLVIFSHKRPLQLYALLESIVDNVQGLGQVTVVYHPHNEGYEQAYQIVQDDFCGVEFLKQDMENSQMDFKQLTLQGAFASDSAYLLFAVDDMIVTDSINVHECIALLEQTNAYAFYLRLGKNIIFDYQASKAHPRAPGKLIQKNFYTWNFAKGIGTWRYPHTVDMALYRKSDIENFLRTTQYNNPNELEASWARNKRTAMNKTGICFEHSKVINIPTNCVQDTFANKNMNKFSPKKLLSLFNDGYKIDLKPFAKINNNSTHMPYTFEFCQR